MVFWRYSNAASETAGGSISALLNPCTFLAKQVSPCIFPRYRLPLNPPPRFLQLLTSTGCMPARRSGQPSSELASTGPAPGNLVTTWLLFSAPSVLQILPDFYLPLLRKSLACNRSPHIANLHLPINIVTQNQFQFKIKILTCTAPQVRPTFYRLKEHSYHEFIVQTHQNNI